MWPTGKRAMGVQPSSRRSSESLAGSKEPTQVLPRPRCAHYGGVNLGPVLAVHGSDPGILRTASHHKYYGRVKGIARGLLHPFPQIGILHYPDMHGLPVHGRRRKARSLQDALDVTF